MEASSILDRIAQKDRLVQPSKINPSALTFAYRDECWKKGKNPFKLNSVDCTIKIISDGQFMIIPKNQTREELDFLLDFLKEMFNKFRKNLKGGKKKWKSKVNI